MITPPRTSIKRKVMLVIMLATATVLLVTVAAFMVYDLVTFRNNLAQNLVMQAKIIGENCNAALIFKNENDASAVLASLRNDPHIIAAALYDEHGKLFAKFPPSTPDASLPAKPLGQGYRFEKSELDVFQPVTQPGSLLGTFYVQSDLGALSQRQKLYGAISLFILTGSLLVAWWISNLLQRRISDPIIALANTARAISGRQDLSLRAEKAGDDEVGDLTDALNALLDRIGDSHRALEKSRAQLQIVTDHASVMLCHIDKSTSFQFANPAYARRFNLTPEMLTGQTIAEVVGQKAYESFQHYVAQALAGERVEYEMEIPYEKLGPHWLHCIYVPEKNSAGEVVGFVGIINDITAGKLAAAALRKSEQQERERAQELAVTLQAIPTPVIIVHDPEGRHMTGNRAADKLVKIPAGGEISVSAPDTAKPVHFKSYKDGRELLPEELPAQRAARGETVSDFEFELVFDDGTFLNLLGYGTPLLDEHGKPRGAVHTLVDITDRKRNEVKMREAMELAEAANRSKDDFLAALSHELRTPLNPVLLIASDAASNHAIPKELRADFESIRRNVELEARLIDDLLDLTRIVRGKLSLEKQPVDVTAVLNEVLTIVQPEMTAKNIALVHRTESVPRMVSGDSVRLHQIFWNLLKNAVKFTPYGGKVTIGSALINDAGMVLIEIQDSGIGLTGSEINHIFDAFSQGEHARGQTSHKFGGLGLGLAISQHLVILHEGSLDAASAGRDLGATFTVKLPLLKSSELAGLPATDKSPCASPPGMATDRPKKNLLLVEDHEPTRMSLARLLTRRNYQVSIADSMAAALKLAGTEKFDMVVSDIGLPDGNGYDLMAALRESHGLKGIALTGYGMEKDMLKGKNAGFVAYLTKPIRIEALEKALNEFV